MSKRRGRPKLHLVRFTVTTTQEVKELLEAQAMADDRSLALYAGRLLAAAVGLPLAPEADLPARRRLSADDSYLPTS